MGDGEGRKRGRRQKSAFRRYQLIMYRPKKRKKDEENEDDFKETPKKNRNERKIPSRTISS